MFLWWALWLEDCSRIATWDHQEDKGSDFFFQKVGESGDNTYIVFHFYLQLEKQAEKKQKALPMVSIQPPPGSDLVATADEAGNISYFQANTMTEEEFQQQYPGVKAVAGQAIIMDNPTAPIVVPDDTTAELNAVEKLDKDLEQYYEVCGKKI